MIEKKIVRPPWANRREPRNEAEKRQLLLSIPSFVDHLDRNDLTYDQWKRRQPPTRAPLQLMKMYLRLIEVG